MSDNEVTQPDRDLASRISAIFDQGHPTPVLVAQIASMVAAHRQPVSTQPQLLPHTLKFENGRYSCASCGAGFTTPCSHWREHLRQPKPLRRWANTGPDGDMQEHPLGEFVLLKDVQCGAVEPPQDKLAALVAKWRKIAAECPSKYRNKWRDVFEAVETCASELEAAAREPGASEGK